MIRLSTRYNPGNFVSRHHLVVPLPDSRHLVMLSGIAIVHFFRPNESGWSWYPEQLELDIDFLAVLPPYKWFWIEQSVPYLTLSAFDVQVPPPDSPFGGGWYHYPGIAVDSFRLSFTQPDYGVYLRSDIAVKYTGSHLYRVAYQVTLAGRFVDQPWIS